MKVKDVITKYNALVPFPWTEAKIEKAGYNPTKFLIGLGKELEECKNKKSTLCKQAIDMLSKLTP